MPLQVRAARNPHVAPNQPAGYRPEYRFTDSPNGTRWQTILGPLYRFSQPEALRRAESFLRVTAPQQVRPRKVPA